MKVYPLLNKATAALQSFSVSGNHIPHRWYITLRDSHGRVHGNAIHLLAEIVFWFRPVDIFDEVSGKIVGLGQKFAAEKLQIRYKQIEDKLGLTKQQAYDSLLFLEEKGIIEKEIVKVLVLPTGQKLYNVMYVDLNYDALMAASVVETPEKIPSNDKVVSVDETPGVCRHEGVVSVDETNTNITLNTDITVTERKGRALSPEMKRPPVSIPEVAVPIIDVFLRATLPEVYVPSSASEIKALTKLADYGKDEVSIRLARLLSLRAQGHTFFQNVAPTAVNLQRFWQDFNRDRTVHKRARAQWDENAANRPSSFDSRL